MHARAHGGARRGCGRAARGASTDARSIASQPVQALARAWVRGSTRGRDRCSEAHTAHTSNRVRAGSAGRQVLRGAVAARAPPDLGGRRGGGHGRCRLCYGCNLAVLRAPEESLLRQAPTSVGLCPARTRMCTGVASWPRRRRRRRWWQRRAGAATDVGTLARRARRAGHGRGQRTSKRGKNRGRGQGGGGSRSLAEGAEGAFAGR